MNYKTKHDTVKIDTTNRIFELNGIPLKTCKWIKIKVAPFETTSAEVILSINCDLKFFSNEVNVSEK